MRYTVWHNPLAQAQRVVVMEDGRAVKYTVPPGGDTRIPAIHDNAIHRVQCTDDECRAKGGFCSKGHDGTIHGGAAVQLQRVRSETALGKVSSTDDPADRPLARGLDTGKEAREQAELEHLAAAQKQQNAEVTALLAQRRADELTAKASGITPAEALIANAKARAAGVHPPSPAEKAAAEKAAADKSADDAAAAEKVAGDKVAADKAAADKTRK